jgi:Tfp pilus assembly protein PilO
MSQINAIPVIRKRKRKTVAKQASVWEQAGSKLIVAIVAPMIVTILISVFGWVAFRATVVEKLDTLTGTVQEIKRGMVSKDYVDESLHGITDRLAADERDINVIRTQLHDDEVRGKH